MVWDMEMSPDGEAIIVTMRTSRMNVVTYELQNDMRTVLDALDADVDGKYASKPIILRSDPDYCRCFSAGLDLKFLATAGKKKTAEYLNSFAAVLTRFLRLERQTIAVISGHAIAAGFFIALICDARIGVEKTDNFRIIANEVHNGLVTPELVTSLIRYKFPPRLAKDVLVYGKLYNPVSALLELNFFDGFVTNQEKVAQKSSYLQTRLKNDPRVTILDNSSTDMDAAGLSAALKYAKLVSADTGACFGQLKQLLYVNDIIEFAEKIKEETAERAQKIEKDPGVLRVKMGMMKALSKGKKKKKTSKL